MSLENADVSRLHEAKNAFVRLVRGRKARVVECCAPTRIAQRVVKKHISGCERDESRPHEERGNRRVADRRKAKEAEKRHLTCVPSELATYKTSFPVSSSS